MKRTWFPSFVALLVLFSFSGQARAQTTARPAPPATPVVGASDTQEAQQPPRSEKRFGYTRFGRAPVVSNAELRQLFPGKIELDASDVLVLLNGSKGQSYRQKMEESVAWSVFGRGTPDADFMQTVRDNLASGKYESKEYRGVECRLAGGQFSGNCDSQLSLPLTYAGTHTDYPPTPVGFNILGILVDPIVPNSGPNAGRWVRVMFTRGFITIEEDSRTQGLYERKSQPCLNVSGEFAAPPPPPQPPKPLPPPPAAPLVAKPAPPPPPPPPPTFDVFLTKVYLKDNPVLPPKNFQDARFEATLPGGRSFVAESAGSKPYKWSDDKGKPHETESVQYVFRNVPVDPDGTVTLDVRETAVPKGWTDKSQHLNIVITKDMLLNLTNNRIESESIEYLNLRKPCRFLKMPCWAWAPIAGAAVVPFIITRTEKPVETVPKKKGGPGGSPVYAY